MNSIIKKVISIIKLIVFGKLWRKTNKHNYTIARNIFPIEKVSVGKNTYGGLYVKTYGNINERLIIGSYCSIAGNVKFLLGGEHPYKKLSTFPFKSYICGLKEDTFTKGPIIVKDDVWIGEECLILSGVTIGQGAIIAARSVVAKDVPPYAIYAGDKVKKYRFSRDMIEKLIKVDYSKFDDEIVKSNIDKLYIDIEIDMLNDEFYNNLSN